MVSVIGRGRASRHCALSQCNDAFWHDSRIGSETTFFSHCFEKRLCEMWTFPTASERGLEKRWLLTFLSVFLGPKQLDCLLDMTYNLKFFFWTYVLNITSHNSRFVFIKLQSLAAGGNQSLWPLCWRPVGGLPFIRSLWLPKQWRGILDPTLPAYNCH